MMIVVENRLSEIKKRVYCREDITSVKQVQLSTKSMTYDFNIFTVSRDIFTSNLTQKRYS